MQTVSCRGSGVGYEGVQSAESVDGLGHDSWCRLGVFEIARHGVNGFRSEAAALSEGVVQPGCGSRRCQRQAMAVGCWVTRDGESDSLAGAGDENPHRQSDIRISSYLRK